MKWQNVLPEDEEILWEGRPAPRCFTFRRWYHSIFGLLLLPLCWVWLDGGQALAVSRSEPLWGYIPWAGFAVACYFVCGHLVRARLEWERTFYAITSQRVVAVGGWPSKQVRTLPRASLRHLKLVPRGEQLGSLFLRGGGAEVLVLACVEHPSSAIELLEAWIRENIERSTPSNGDE